MSSHDAGEKLYVEGYGSYFLEWHLAADLKLLSVCTTFLMVKMQFIVSYIA
jgi:hypothetical protein